MENVTELDSFNGWGLHILDPQENGITLEFIKNEIKVYFRFLNKRKFRKLLTKLIPIGN